MQMVIAYDIAHPRRLQRVAKVLKDYGLRVQNSIFEVEISPATFRELRQRTEALLDPMEDGVKYFPLCGRCSGLVLNIGPAAGEEQRELLIV
jgi:CRISPR-associated protein Cas2